MMAGYLEPAAAREIFGPRDAVLAWGSQGGDGYAQVADGGYRVTGTWAFASGGRRATWLGAPLPIVERDGTPARAPAATPEIRTMLFPVEQAVMTDIWHVMGLRGTGSDAYTVTDLFVPDGARRQARRAVGASPAEPALLRADRQPLRLRLRGARARHRAHDARRVRAARRRQDAARRGRTRCARTRSSSRRSRRRKRACARPARSSSTR